MLLLKVHLLFIYINTKFSYKCEKNINYKYKINKSYKNGSHRIQRRRTRFQQSN